MHFKQGAVGFTGGRSSFTLLFLSIVTSGKVQTKYSAVLQVHRSVLTGLLIEEQILVKTFYFSTQIITDA